jgi:DNA-binding MarR family transcriptional regulator
MPKISMPKEYCKVPPMAARPQTALSAAPADEFLTAFDAFARAVRRARGAAPVNPDALTLSQYGLLQAMAGRESVRVRELAAEAGVTPSTATRILDALERRSIVRRARSPEDRRGVTVTLTEQGRAVLQAQGDWMRDRQLAFYAGLPSQEQDLAPDLLIRLAALIDELAAGNTA